MNIEVSIIVPCYNEEDTIQLLLEAIHRQTYDRRAMEVVVADGMSTDRTRSQIEEFISRHPELRVNVVDNEKRTIPAGLNRAIEAAQGDIFIRLDAHAEPEPGYVERCVATLARTGAANVGGVWIIRPLKDNWISRSIAAAASHPLGAGGARYRTGGKQGETDTVPFGAFPRQWVEKIGPFHEELETNEDYEYNVRLNQAGGVIYFDPEIRSIYYARPNILSLAKQYLRYGYWKARMLLRYPSSIRWRQAIPPLFVSSVMVLSLLGFVYNPAWWLLCAILGVYVAITFIAGIMVGFRKKDVSIAFGFPIAIWTMHFNWGGAFLWSMIKNWRRR
jgi:glycosyltransferase involved in cell wall biosynthesis